MFVLYLMLFKCTINNKAILKKILTSDTGICVRSWSRNCPKLMRFVNWVTIWRTNDSKDYHQQRDMGEIGIQKLSKVQEKICELNYNMNNKWFKRLPSATGTWVRSWSRNCPKFMRRFVNCCDDISSVETQARDTERGDGRALPSKERRGWENPEIEFAFTLAKIQSNIKVQTKNFR